MKLRTASTIVTAFVVLCLPGTVHADKLGKLFVKAATIEVNGQQFPSTELEDSVNDIKKRLGDFTLAKDEAEADFLLVVIKRGVEERDDNRSAKVAYATLSVRDGDGWRPGTQLRNAGFFSEGSWGNAARGIIGAAEKWVKESRKKK